MELASEQVEGRGLFSVQFSPIIADPRMDFRFDCVFTRQAISVAPDRLSH